MVGSAIALVLSLRKYWKWIAIGAAAIFLFAAGIIIVKSYNDAIETAQEEKVRADAWHKATISWQKAFERSESLREQEQRQAISSASRERNVCNQRVADALRTATRIREVVRVERNENETICPAGSVITSDELRSIFGTNSAR
jgi:hypothetical protein